MQYFRSLPKQQGIAPIDGIRIKEAHLRNVMVTWVELEPGSVLPEHRHPHEQITVVIEGAMEMTVGVSSMLMRKGDAAIVPSDTPHSVRVMERTIALDAWHPIRTDYIAAD